MFDDTQADLRVLTARIVAAFAARNQMRAAELLDLVTQVHARLAQLDPAGSVASGQDMSAQDVSGQDMSGQDMFGQGTADADAAPSLAPGMRSRDQVDWSTAASGSPIVLPRTERTTSGAGIRIHSCAGMASLIQGKGGQGQLYGNFPDLATVLYTGHDKGIRPGRSPDVDVAFDSPVSSVSACFDIQRADNGQRTGFTAVMEGFDAGGAPLTSVQVPAKLPRHPDGSAPRVTLKAPAGSAIGRVRMSVRGAAGKPIEFAVGNLDLT